MKILHLAYLNNDPEILPFWGPKFNLVSGEPRMRSSIPNILCTGVYHIKSNF